MSWSTIFWIVTTLGAGGIVAAVLFMTGVLPMLMATKTGRILLGVCTVGIGLVLAYLTAVGQGEAKERARREKEDEEFTDGAARTRRTVHDLPDDQLDSWLRDGTETKRKGDH